ncbi:MAG: hypothetical protein C4K49_02655 [Candidatus Thorarchaeota archaeon]|nr:MAG: hypothetical protein C4K49_02655 [Candidatus Thorarchaeota archaeon]
MNGVADLVLRALRDAGRGGLLAEELTQRLDIDYQVIMPTIENMLAEGIVVQEQEVENPRYFMKTQLDDEAGHLSDLNGCPCFHCLRIDRCGVRQPDSPVICRSLEEWVVSSESD